VTGSWSIHAGITVHAGSVHSRVNREIALLGLLIAIPALLLVLLLILFLILLSFLILILVV